MNNENYWYMLAMLFMLAAFTFFMLWGDSLDKYETIERDCQTYGQFVLGELKYSCTEIAE
jgi:hypothetical protein